MTSKLAFCTLLLFCGLCGTKGFLIRDIKRAISDVANLGNAIKNEVVNTANTIKNIAEVSINNIQRADELAKDLAEVATTASLDLVQKGIEAGIGPIMKKFVEKESRSAMNIQFSLFTKKNIFSAQMIESVANTDYKEYSNSIKASNFDGSKKTIFMIHGYGNNGWSGWPIATKNLILTRKPDDVNVIVVNWDKGADSLIYIQSARNTEVVGALVADLIKELHSTTGASYGNMWVIGHSLGAQTAGYVGENIPGLGRITGLDPARPEFQGEAEGKRLDANDAILVDVIHTDGKSGGLGVSQKSGDIDFYPNGGSGQPGCKPTALSVLQKIFTGKYFSIKGISKDVTCNHSRAYYLFMDSILHSYKNCGYMGYDADKATKGDHYPRTNSGSPYC